MTYGRFDGDVTKKRHSDFAEKWPRNGAETRLKHIEHRLGNLTWNELLDKEGGEVPD
jgi:hypothetical protein